MTYRVLAGEEPGFSKDLVKFQEVHMKVPASCLRAHILTCSPRVNPKFGEHPGLKRLRWDLGPGVQRSHFNHGVSSD